MSEPTIEDYARAGERAKISAVAAASYAVLSLPLSYQAYDNFGLATQHFQASKNVSAHIEQAIKDAAAYPQKHYVAMNNGSGIARSFKEVQEARDYANLCHQTAVRESFASAGYALAVVLPLALLAKRFFSNFRLNREWNAAVAHEKAMTTSAQTATSVDDFLRS